MSRNRCDTACVCGWRLSEAIRSGPMMDETEYLGMVGRLNYLGNHGHGWVHSDWLSGPATFQRLICPICCRVYAGWFARNHDATIPEPELFDSSFFFAFNDEPASPDEPLQPAYELRDILQAWVDAGRPPKVSQ